MTIPSFDWLFYASKFVPDNRQDWLTAMRAEYKTIENPKARQSYARGCFMAVLGEWVQSRRALSILARIGGAGCLILLAVFGLLSARKMGLNTEQDLSVYAQIISMLCIAYMGAGLMVLLSLRMTRFFALGGFLAASLAFVWFQISPPVLDGVSAEFLTAVSIETAGLMAALFIACLYLTWLYNPDHFAV